MNDRIVTCVFCGYAYPAGTPTSHNQRLIDHIKVCEAHPLRAYVKAVGPDQAGRPLAQLLRDASEVISDGPLRDCLVAKAIELEELP